MALNKTLSPQNRDAKLRKLLATYEDAGHGACWLRDPRIAALVENAILHFDAQRYRLIAWCLMPNHVHALIETGEPWPLAAVVHSWKSFTSHEANRILRRSGDFWFREYFDRFIRDERHFVNAVTYIEQNPVKAGAGRVAGGVAVEQRLAAEGREESQSWLMNSSRMYFLATA